jgi:hypothetical protein
MASREYEHEHDLGFGSRTTGAVLGTGLVVVVKVERRDRQAASSTAPTTLAHAFRHSQGGGPLPTKQGRWGAIGCDRWERRPPSVWRLSYRERQWRGRGGEQREDEQSRDGRGEGHLHTRGACGCADSLSSPTDA